MRRLRIVEDTAPQAVLRETRDHDAIARELEAIGVGFERWEAAQPVRAGDPPEAILAAYRADIDRLVAEHGFNSVDVVSISPDHPDREAMRGKFLDEHAHRERKCASSSMAAGCSPCTWATRSTRCCARKAT